ncbi:hypothetical protein [Streptomyces sp. CC219B]|uniref:hypothetical protein n=1 Tax=Streptomyces sp. CC219B TaxID=3044574 RepID=UPI0024A8EEDA|nr:hypothetical protein [Streptomyces sp. CC219B]
MKTEAIQQAVEHFWIKRREQVSARYARVTSGMRRGLMIGLTEQQSYADQPSATVPPAVPHTPGALAPATPPAAGPSPVTPTPLTPPDVPGTAVPPQNTGDAEPA